MNTNTTPTAYTIPIALSVEPIHQLLLVDFRNDPEYSIIEIQSYRNSRYGNGLRILLYRLDKKVDVYWQQGVVFDAANFRIGDGVANCAEVELSAALFEITEQEVKVDIRFTDIKKRQIELKVHEYRSNNSFAFLAPVGKDIKDPDRLFLVYMTGFNFLRQAGTVVHAAIDGRIMQPAVFPVSIHGEKLLFARYASELLIGEINAKPQQLLQLQLSPGINVQDQLQVKVDENREIENIALRYGAHQIEMEFLPGLPNLSDIPEGRRKKGQWLYRAAGRQITGGCYQLERHGDQVSVHLDVRQSWKPEGLPFTLRIFVWLIRSFRVWPATYRWLGVVDIRKKEFIKTAWSRKNQQNEGDWNNE